MPLDFSTPESTLNTLESLEINLYALAQNQPLTPEGQKLIIDALSDYMRIKAYLSVGGKKSKGGGRPKKFASDTERVAFHNAKRRGKAQ